METRRNICIEMKDGNVIRYEFAEYTEYRYDRRCFIVINGDQWIGIFNMDAVACIQIE